MRMGTFLHKHEFGRAMREQARPQGAEWVGDMGKKSTVGDGWGAVFSRCISSRLLGDRTEAGEVSIGAQALTEATEKE